MTSNASLSHTQTRTQFNKLLLLVPYTFVLLILLISALHQQPHSITSEEAHTLWIVQDERSLTSAERASPRLIVSTAVGQMRRTLDRSLNAGHPPLYFVLLEVWTWLAGDTRIAVRLFSALLVMLAVVLTARLTARRLRAADFNPSSPLLVSVVMALAALAPPTIYAARSAEPAALLMLTSALNLWLLLRWMDEPGVVRSLLYSLSLVLALYSHLFAVLLIGLGAAVQMLRLLRGESLRGPTQWDRLWVRSFTYGIIRWLLCAALALIVYLPLFLFLSPPGAVPDSGLALWSVVLPWLMVFVLAGWIPRLHQRIGIAPLMVGFIVGAVLLWLAYPLLIPAVPDWDQAADAVIRDRHLLEPLVIAVPPDSAAAYTVRETDLNAGITLDLGWRDFSAEEHAALMGKLSTDHAIWLVMPADTPSETSAYTFWQQVLTRQGRSAAVYGNLGSIKIERWTSTP